MSLTKRTARGIPSDSKHKRPYPFLAHAGRHSNNTYYAPLSGGGDLRFYPPPGTTNPTKLRQHHHPTRTKMSNASRQVGNRRLPPLPAPGQSRRTQPTSPHGAGKSSIGGSTYHGSQTSSARSRGGSSTSNHSSVRVSVSYDMIVKGLSTYGNGYSKNNRISHSQATSDQTGHIPENVAQEHIRHYLDENPQFLDDYVINHVNAEQVEKWLNSIRKKPSPTTSAGRSPRHQTPSLKRPTLQSTTSTVGITGPLNTKFEGTFAGESIRASHSNARQWKSSAFQERRKQMYDLAIDIQTYNHRLGLINELAVCIEERIHADGYTLYAVTGNGSELYEYKNNEKSDSGQRPSWAVAKGQTITGYVAYSGQVVNTKDPTGNELHPHGVAAQSVTAHAVLALPVIELTDELSGSDCEDHDQLAGVLEFYRTEAKAFSTEDEMHADSYLLWGTLTVHYAQFGNDKDFDKKLYVDMIRQRKQNDFLLAVTKSIFTDIVSMDSVIMKIMNFAQKLVNADRASLFLVDSKKNELYARIFDIGNGLGNPMVDKDQKEIRFSMAKGVAGHVASTGDILNIPDAYQDERFNREVDLQTGYVTKTILCMPIYIRGNVIGVVQMVNKKHGLFTRADEQAFETFAVYCGLALHHAKLYDKIRRSEQKHKVALEVLSYHAMCVDNEFKGLRNMPLPDPMPDIARYDFSPWGLDEEAKPLYVLCMFKDMFELNKFDYDELCRFILTVRKNYRRVPYHNWTHAFSVAHSVYTMIMTGQGQVFNPLEALALFVACLCHDLDHRGKNNAFMVNTASPLASVYSTSTMEHHHFNMTITILQNDGHNIFKHLSSEEYKQVLGDIRHAILATDLALFFPNKAKLKKIVEEKNFSWDNQEHRQCVKALSMTACDLAANTKPWHIQQQTVKVIFDEFYQQGDEEKAAGRNPIPMMDRDRAHELPANQVSFIVGICLPCYDLLAQLVPSAKPMYEGAAKNLQNWSALVAKQKSEEEDKKPGDEEGKTDGDEKKEEKKPDKPAPPPAKAPPPSPKTSSIPKEVLESDDGLE